MPLSDPIEIITETPDWLIACKPAPLLIHPTRPDEEYTFWHALQERFPDEPLFLVNRLDRETSGLVLVSRNKETSSILGKMVMERRIHKHYLALVSGKTPEEGTINQPIGRKSDFGASDIYVQQIIHDQGKPALTKYRRLETRQHASGPISLIEVELLTGRMHQIRVHMQSAGHPVIGDKLYGSDPAHYLRVVKSGWSDDMLEPLLLRRQALHASEMTFSWRESTVRVKSSLPEDLEQFWNGCDPT